MGLDTVELVMAIEDEFRIEIPNADAERMTTVGEVYNYLRKHLSTTDPGPCLTQAVFYKLRKALMQTYALRRSQIRPRRRLSEVLTMDDIQDGSAPWLEMHIGLRVPDLQYREMRFFGFEIVPTSIDLTISRLVRRLIELNIKDLPPEREGTNDDIWNRLVKVFLNQLNVNVDEVVPEASITKDLGAD